MLINYEKIVKYYVKAHLPSLFNLYNDWKKKKYKIRVAKSIMEHEAFYKCNASYPLFETIELQTQWINYIQLKDVLTILYGHSTKD